MMIRRRRRKHQISIQVPSHLLILLLTAATITTTSSSSAHAAALLPSNNNLKLSKQKTLEHFKQQTTTTSSSPNNKQPPVTTPPTTLSTTTTSPPTQKQTLLLIRILFLSFYSSLGSLLPYLPVYYHTLGHDGLSIGLIGAVKPITTFLVAPLWGILSDKAHCLHTILQVTFVAGLCLQLCVGLYDGFAWLTTTVFLSALMNAPVKSLMDCMVMDVLEDKSRYGRMRLWGQVGFGLGSSCVGLLLNRAATSSSSSLSPNDDDNGESYYSKVLTRVSKGYRLAFLSHGLLAIPSFICMRAFQRMSSSSSSSVSSVATATARNRKKEKTTTTTTKKGNKEKTQIVKGLLLLARSTDAILFFTLVFVVGVSSGIIENFAYVRMREVGGTGRDMGISRLVSSAAGAPMFWFSGTLTEKLGADIVLVMSLGSYVVRFFIYAFMRKALEGLAAEALRGVTFAAFWSTGTIYAHNISPEGMSATMLMFLNAMYGGLGQSLGAIIGGKLQSQFGTVKTFIYSGCFDLVFIGFIVTYLVLRGDSSSFKNPKHLGTYDDEDDDNDNLKKNK